MSFESKLHSKCFEKASYGGLQGSSRHTICYWFRNFKQNDMWPESEEEELEMKHVPSGQNALGSLMHAMICSRHGLRSKEIIMDGKSTRILTWQTLDNVS